MSTELQILVALGTTVISAIVGALLQPWWAGLIRPKSKLSVKLSHYPFQLPSYLSDLLREHWMELAAKKDSENLKKLNAISDYSGFSLIEIANNSTKTINNISVHVDSSISSEVVLAADVLLGNKKSPTIFGSSCEIGSLRPNTTCSIQLWSRSDVSDDFFGRYFKKIKVTADEYDKIQMDYPIPASVMNTNFLIRKKPIFQSLAVIFLLFAGLLGAYWAIIFSQWLSNRQ